MIEITLPFPDSSLAPNRSKGTHWGVTTGARKKARAEAYIFARNALATTTFGAPVLAALLAGTMAVDITFVQPDKRKRDLDGLLSALKPGLDGIADALGIDDSRFNPITVRRRDGEKPGEGYVSVRVLA